jgi:hypothetical protein
VVEAELSHATGAAEREAACAMVDDLQVEHRITVGADKAYDAQDFMVDMRSKGATPCRRTPRRAVRRSMAERRAILATDQPTQAQTD